MDVGRAVPHQPSVLHWHDINDALVTPQCLARSMLASSIASAALSAIASNRGHHAQVPSICNDVSIQQRGISRLPLPPRAARIRRYQEDVMKVREALIAWSSRTSDFPQGRVKVGPTVAEGKRDWTDEYEMTGGAAWIKTRSLNGAWARARVFIDFHELVTDHGIAPEVVHQAFSVIDEYRDAVVNRVFYREQPPTLKTN